MKFLAFIPARSGSQSIKNKNMRLFLGKPLLHHTIIQAKKIRDLKIFISTDSQKILKSTKKLGCDQSYLRPKHLSKNNSNIISSIIHCIKWQKKRGNRFDAIVVLQPTSPLRSTSELKKAIKTFKEKNFKSLIGVSKMREHPYDCIETKKNGWNFLRKNLKFSTNRQSYKKNFYYINGSFYISTVDIILKRKKLVLKDLTKLFVTSYQSGFEIDYMQDLKITESLFKN